MCRKGPKTFLGQEHLLLTGFSLSCQEAPFSLQVFLGMWRVMVKSQSLSE